MSEENGNKKAEKDHFFSCGCVFMIFVGIAFIAIMLAISYFSYSCEEKKDDMNSGYVDDSSDDSPSGIEQVVYRNIQRSDYSVDHKGDFTDATIIIQANVDIKEFSATIVLYDENMEIIKQRYVHYEDMRSGTRYEETFHLTFSELMALSSYGTTNVSGKVKR